MKNVTPIYIPYKKRILGGLARVLVYSIFLTFLIFMTDVNEYPIAAVICFIGFIIFNVYHLIKRNKKYIKSIRFSETLIEIIIVEKETELLLISNEPDNIRIKLVQLFFGFNRIGNNIKLQIDVRKNGKFEKIFEQYEIGGWTLELFKETFTLYSQVKGRFATTGADMEGTNKH